MLSVLHRPEAITPALLSLVRPLVRYDADGRGSAWLSSGGPLAPEFADVVRAVRPERGDSEYAVILQCYRDGAAVTPCHGDLGSAGFVLSVGATRTLRLHRVPESGWLPSGLGASGCGDYALDAVFIECVHGTAVVMDEEFHAGWHHQIVPDPAAGERLSLVFRETKR